MKVPDVVKIAMKMKAVHAADGPASHSHQLIPRKPPPVKAAGALSTPNLDRRI